MSHWKYRSGFHTKADVDEFRTEWLSRRIGHQWNGENRCTYCHRRYGKAAGRLCPKRKKPSRWRMHFRRALQRANYPTEIPKRDARWLLAQIRDLEQQTRYEPTDLPGYWKYHKTARQYRKYLRQWWALPAADVAGVLPMTSDPPTRAERQIAQGRARLLKRARAEQARTIQDGGTTYTFYPQARVALGGKMVNLFEEAQP